MSIDVQYSTDLQYEFDIHSTDSRGRLSLQTNRNFYRKQKFTVDILSFRMPKTRTFPCGSYIYQLRVTVPSLATVPSVQVIV